MSENTLRNQLELVRFEKATDYIRINAGGLKHLNTQELAHLNQVLTHSQGDPWREEAAIIRLPSGKEATFTLYQNPQMMCRDILSDAVLMAREGDVVNAATHLYSQLVLHHFFRDANRRTAVAAVYWLLYDRGISIKALGLLELGIGDLRDEHHLENLRTLIRLAVGSKSQK